MNDRKTETQTINYHSLKKKILFCLILLFLWLIRYQGEWQNSILYEQYVGGICEVEGKVYFQKQTKKGFEYYLKAENIIFSNHISKKSNQKFHFYFPNEIKLNSNITVKAELAFFSMPKNPGDWNKKHYFMSKNIYYQLKKPQVTVRQPGKQTTWQTIKEWLRTQSEYLFPETEKGLFLSLLVGDKQGLEQSVTEQFRKLGVSHVLAISGLHVGLLLLTLQMILKKLPLYNWMKFLITMSFLAGYVMLSGAQPSILRAALMVFIMESAYFFNREKEPKTAFMLTFVLLTFSNPFYIYDVGFLLSFLTVFGILYLHPILFTEKPKWVQLIGITIVSQVLLLPVYSLYFHKVSLISVLANLWVVPAISYFLGLSTLAVFVSGFWLIGGQVIAGSAYFLSAITQWLSGIMAVLPWSEVPLRAMSGGEILLFYLIVLCFLLTKKKRILLALLFFVTVFFPFSLSPKFTMLDVGQAESIVIQYRNQTIVVDVGLQSNKSTVNYLAYLGKSKVDLVFLSHLDKDHAGGLEYLLENCKVETIGISESYRMLTPELAKAYSLALVYKQYQDLLALAEKYQTKVTYWQAGDELRIDELEMKFLYPVAEEIPFTSNDFSFVAEMSYHDNNLLLTGDIGEEVEEILEERKQLSPVTVLKVAHHGSKYASSLNFLEITRPKLAIISCGRYNKYGHPSQDLVSLFRHQKTLYRITAWDGPIFFEFNQKGEVIIHE